MGKSKKNKLDPVHKAFFDQAPSDDFGHGQIYNFWKSLYLVFTFGFYFLLYIDSIWVKWVCLAYSIIIFTFSLAVIYGMKKDYIYDLNPFDFVSFQLISFIVFVIHYGIMLYIIYLLDNNQFHSETAPVFLNFIFTSIGTVLTFGFIDVTPNSLLTKGLAIIELIISFWFLVTILPIAFGLQTERIRQFSASKNKFDKELKKGMKEGRWKDVTKKNKRK